ncbi:MULTISPECIES: hypothetical protein [unclassified Lactococcus]|uniref:hypothetical protein n=1 Tax=unclassified Lactococcus TaxID=2643510 RepID=UPI0011C78B4D|nr:MULTISPECIES: hypothetical protein [unclassified Lactococcus]MQW21998.1 hypothetical protein [Lactococcus sp. dk101]TXK36822.1 hypothetical protein FVP42_10625 [Lactococcus sp. dk310]TXK47481.1 hypothetical protein FVP43_10220 [Lactococcus sp. dk322]
MDGMNISAITKEYSDEIEKQMSEFIYNDLKANAQVASGRARKVRIRSGKVYRYRNTGQLARMIAIKKEGDHTTVDAGTRGSYGGKSYHGMYFLVEKAGIKAVDQTLKRAKMYVNQIKI